MELFARAHRVGKGPTKRKWGPESLPGPTLAHMAHVRFGDCHTRVGGDALPSLVRRSLAVPSRLPPVSLRFPATLRRNLSGGPEGPAIIVRSAIVGVGSFPPGHDAEASCGSRRKDPDSRTGSACFRRGPKSGRNHLSSSASADSVGARFRRGPKSGRSLPPSSASASTGGCPSGFSLPRVTPFPSGPKTFRRGVAAFVQAASVAKILSAFQRLAPRSAVAFSLPTHECCASNPSRASTIYPRYPQAVLQRWISAPSRYRSRCASSLSLSALSRMNPAASF